MNLLLDTHVLLWWLSDDRRLGDAGRRAIAQEGVVMVSAASVWEIEIKRSLGKLRAPDDVVEVIEESGFSPLPITVVHAVAAGGLPRHHDDPFDRMLVAQAREEALVVVTGDRRFGDYGVDVLEP